VRASVENSKQSKAREEREKSFFPYSVAERRFVASTQVQKPCQNCVTEAKQFSVLSVPGCAGMLPLCRVFENVMRVKICVPLAREQSDVAELYARWMYDGRGHG